MNQRTNRGIKRSKWGYALALLWLAACGGVVGKPNVGGESHFLRHCGDGCGPGLECVADVCTRGCRVAGGNCSDLAATATCTNASLEPGALAVCDVACQSSADCRALGADFQCDGGFCRGPAPTTPGQGGSASVAGSSGVSGGGAVGGSSGAGGTGTADVCELPFVQGPCDANFPVFAFEGGECVPRIYGGCQGNGNRFDTLAACQSQCGAGPANVCELPFVQGPCEAAFPVFAFEGGECVPKIYGGCEGNGNRFDTLEQCQNRCGGVEVPATRCLVPFDSGPCDAAFQVFAFQDGQCRPAQYGGCEGNANRFNTLEQCLSSCEGRPSVAPCPEGRVEQEICLECGPAGGCSLAATACATPCDDALDSTCAPGLTCVSGFCQAGGCL